MNTGNGDFRLSRISHPRATLWAMILLALVFLGLGLLAGAFAPAAALSGSGSLVLQRGESALAALATLIPGH